MLDFVCALLAMMSCGFLLHAVVSISLYYEGADVEQFELRFYAGPSSRDIKRHMEQTQSSLLKNRCAVKVAAAAARAGAQNKANTKHKRTSSTGGATLNTGDNHETTPVGNMQLPNPKQKQSRFSDSAQRDTSPRTPNGAVGRKTRHSPSHGTSSGGTPGKTGHNKSDQDRSYSSFISEIAAEEYPGKKTHPHPICHAKHA